MKSLSLWLSLVMALGVGFSASLDERLPADAKAEPKPQVLRECLILPPVGRAGRAPLFQDVLEARLVAGEWAAPKAGDEVALPDGTKRRWEELRAADNGDFNHAALRGGYAFFAVPAERERVVLLDAAGHNMVYVNGEPRPGDPYRHGYVHLPILLKQGVNDLLFHVGRGSLSAKLIEVNAGSGARFNPSDPTVPDLIVGEKVDAWAGVVVLNTTTETSTRVRLRSGAGTSLHVDTPVPPIPPLSLRKVGFKLAGPAVAAEGSHVLKLELVRDGDERQVLDHMDLTLARRRPDQTHRRTFLSAIDGGVQYFAVVPKLESRNAKPETTNGEKAGLVLTLHGAGVEAIGQANAYAAKDWCHIVAPTNRRPYGFDWEDWGRLDAVEVLDLAVKQLDVDRQRIYLTGHSMGGHGAWHLGVTYPDRFAAVGPSAGWISMFSYAGGRKPDKPTAVEELLIRATTPSDTLALATNLSPLGVYVLHGDRDDNVPVQQARIMRKHLGEFHANFAYHEEPGMGHWWSKPSPPHVGGAACVDWPPMFEFFARHRLPRREEVREIGFTTASPGVSAECHWARIEAQVKPFTPSSLKLRCDPARRRISGTTSNVLVLSLDLAPFQPGEPVHLELDGQALSPVPWSEKAARLPFVSNAGKWELISGWRRSWKSAQRCGPFKDAFQNRMVFVYGTQGTREENAWALAKARYDAETFWYRGNGSVDVIPDSVFDPGAEPDRNVILYGNAGTNASWKFLLGDGPVRVTSGQVRLGGKELAGEDLACLLVRPRSGSDRALVAAVCGAGLKGMRLTNRLPYLVSGVSYPDCLIFGSDVHEKGLAGVRAAGFFGVDWKIENGVFVTD